VFTERYERKGYVLFRLIFFFTWLSNEFFAHYLWFCFMAYGRYQFENAFFLSVSKVVCVQKVLLSHLRVLVCKGDSFKYEMNLEEHVIWVTE
jgi:hypothetical protein